MTIITYYLLWILGSYYGFSLTPKFMIYKMVYVFMSNCLFYTHRCQSTCPSFFNKRGRKSSPPCLIKCWLPNLAVWVVCVFEVSVKLSTTSEIHCQQSMVSGDLTVRFIAVLANSFIKYITWGSIEMLYFMDKGKKDLGEKDIWVKAHLI